MAEYGKSEMGMGMPEGIQAKNRQMGDVRQWGALPGYFMEEQSNGSMDYMKVQDRLSSGDAKKLRRSQKRGME